MGVVISQEARAFYRIRRRKAVFTEACLQERDAFLEIRLLFLGKGWGRGRGRRGVRG